jgi:hypothetical protein
MPATFQSETLKEKITWEVCGTDTNILKGKLTYQNRIRLYKIPKP